MEIAADKSMTFTQLAGSARSNHSDKGIPKIRSPLASFLATSSKLIEARWTSVWDRINFRMAGRSNSGAENASSQAQVSNR